MQGSQPFYDHAGARVAALLVVFVAISHQGLSSLLALFLGVLAGLALNSAERDLVQALAGRILRWAVMLLGFGLSLGGVVTTGRASLLPSLLSIVGILVLGLLLGRFFKVGPRLAFLVSGGTAICGGSAIASLAPAVGATAAETGLAMAVVFVLNSFSLLVFPLVGAWFGLSPEHYAQWCALGIHDTSSVAGAASVLGPDVMGHAVTIKLTRALWIVPLTLLAGKLYRGSSGLKLPWFMVGFVASSCLVSLFPSQAPFFGGLAALGRHLLSGSLFLIGCALSFKELRQAGAVFLHGFWLWVLAAFALLLLLH